MDAVESVHLLFDEEAAEEAELEAALAGLPVYRYAGTGDAAPAFAEVAVKDGLIFAEPELGDLLLSPVISRELRCPICKDMLRDPHFTVPCGHVFCNGCIKESLESGWRTCPICRTGLERTHQTVKARTIDNLLSEVQIYCENGVAYSKKDKTWQPTAGPSACNEILRLTEGPAHFQVCPFKLLKCFFHGEGCTEISLRKDSAAHWATCEFRTVRCSCGERVRVIAEREHAQMCPAAMVDCPHRDVGCGFTIRRSEMAVHLRYCPYEALKGLLAQKDAKIEALSREVEKLRGKVELLPLWDMQWSGETRPVPRTCFCAASGRRAGP